VLNLTRDEAAARADLAREIGLDLERPVIALNTGAGGRWELKKWRTEGFLELIEMILGEPDAQVVLVGGELESGRNAFIKSKFDRRVRNPVLRNIRRLVRTVELCDAIVTGDTLALHVALGLGKRVIALFGPTSPAEIDMYGLGAKVVPDIDCVCCYNDRCGREPNCMDLVGADEVYRHLAEQMRIAASGRSAEENAEADGALSRGEECMVGEPTADW
jgi:ADP-heptose:LPS heptosyltransferase